VLCYSLALIAWLEPGTEQAVAEAEGAVDPIQTLTSEVKRLGREADHCNVVPT